MLCKRKKIAGNKLRGNRVGRVFGRDQFKVLLWWGDNTLAITASAVMSSFTDNTSFDASVGVVCIVTTRGRVIDWFGLA